MANIERCTGCGSLVNRFVNPDHCPHCRGEQFERYQR